MCNPLQEVKNAVSSLGDAGQSIITGASNVVNNFLDNPLPVIETVALTWVLGPEALAVDLEPATIAAVSNAAVTAANGGDVQSIALNAGAAYLGSQAGKAVGETVSPIEGKTLEQLGPQYSDTALLKQVVTSSSAAAATTALRGGDLTAILTSGISGGVNSAVTDALKAQGYTNIDQRMVANAAAAATGAILKGTSISSAIGSSVAATTLAATISGKVDQINKNNELGTSAMKQITDLQAAAQKYYDENDMKTLESNAKSLYEAANNSKNTYNDLKSEFDTKYANYTKNKDYFENYDKKMVAEGYESTYFDDGTTGYSKRIGGHWETRDDGEGGTYQTYIPDVAATTDADGNVITPSSVQMVVAPTKDSFKTNANADAKRLNELAPKIEEVAKTANESIDSFKKAQDALKPHIDYYNSNFITPATDLQNKIKTAAASNQDLATQLGKDVNDYQGLITKDASGVSNLLYDQKVVDQALNAYKIADAQIAASGTQYAQADNGTATDAGAGNTRTVRGVYKFAEDGTLQEFVPDKDGNLIQVPMQQLTDALARGHKEGEYTTRTYIVNDDNNDVAMSPLSETTSDVPMTRTLKDGSKLEYLPDGTTVRTNPNGSVETYDADGNLRETTAATQSSGSALYDALELAFQNNLKAGVKTGAVRNADGSITVGDTTVKPDGTVTGTGAGNAKVNPDGSVTLGPVTIGSGVAGGSGATTGGAGATTGGAAAGTGAATGSPTSGTAGIGGAGGITTTASTDPAIAQRLAAEKAAAEKAAAEKAAEKAAAELKAAQEAAAAAQLASQKSANIGASRLGIMALIPQLQGALGKAQELPTAQAQQQQPEVVKTSTPLSLESPLDVNYFGEQQQMQQPKKDTQSQDGTVKIASGGFMDDLLELLHKRG